MLKQFEPTGTVSTFVHTGPEPDAGQSVGTLVRPPRLVPQMGGVRVLLISLRIGPLRPSQQVPALSDEVHNGVSAMAAPRRCARARKRRHLILRKSMRVPRMRGTMRKGVTKSACWIASCPMGMLALKLVERGSLRDLKVSNNNIY